MKALETLYRSASKPMRSPHGRKVELKKSGMKRGGLAIGSMVQYRVQRGTCDEFGRYLTAGARVVPVQVLGSFIELSGIDEPLNPSYYLGFDTARKVLEQIA